MYMTETQPVLGNNAQTQQLSKISTEELSNKNSTLNVSEKIKKVYQVTPNYSHYHWL